MKRFIFVIVSICFIIVLSGCFRDDPDGEIIPLADDFAVGQPIPLVLQVSEDYDDLHMEMWFCTLKQNDSTTERFDYLEEEMLLAERYSTEAVEEIFKDSPVDIYRDDLSMVTLFSPRIVLFTPLESGTYTLSVAGYYHSTSPSDITSLEVVVHD